jgi:hypothetical protein
MVSSAFPSFAWILFPFFKNFIFFAAVLNFVPQVLEFFLQLLFGQTFWFIFLITGVCHRKGLHYASVSTQIRNFFFALSQIFLTQTRPQEQQQSHKRTKVSPVGPQIL